jgi:hypothetical protein
LDVPFAVVLPLNFFIGLTVIVFDRRSVDPKKEYPDLVEAVLEKITAPGLFK